MTKLSHHILFTVLITIFLTLSVSSAAQNNYHVNIRAVDRDSSFLKNELGLQNNFFSEMDARQYISQLSLLLQAKGFVTASIDTVRYDSTKADLVLFVGKRYSWAQLNTSRINPALLYTIGWKEKTLVDKAIDFDQVALWENKML